MATYLSQKLIVRLLDQLLGPYVSDLSRDKLRGVGMWSGNLVLSDLELREEAPHKIDRVVARRPPARIGAAASARLRIAHVGKCRVRIDANRTGWAWAPRRAGAIP